MPVGDMLLTAKAGAPTTTVARHATYIVYILVTFALLNRFASRMND